MHLADLLDRVTPGPDQARWHLEGDDTVTVTSLTLDSRAVTEGALFACVPGEFFDGHEFGSQAVASGAHALLVERLLPLPVPQLVVREVRPAMAQLASAINGHPSHSLQLVGVTGTNGKTTTVQLISAALAAAGVNSRSIGTLTGIRTTPESPELQSLLRQMLDDGVRSVAMEVSSHALVQHRVDGTRFDVGVFSNLSPDHLDFHADLEDYFHAKALLFRPDMVDHAVINIDDPYGARLAAMVQVPVTAVSRADVDVIDVGLEGSVIDWCGHRIRLGLAGHFNIDNALVAAAALRRLGLSDTEIAGGLSSAPAVPGRFEVVTVDGIASPTIVVDYSHTPDGIEKVLQSVKQIRPDAEVSIVFGCGGDRDASKRPLMALAAETYANTVILTSDNPRTEDPMAIIDDAVAGLRRPDDATVEPDRRAAIGYAITHAAPGAVVVVAGKGNETTQTIGTRAEPFDDRVVAAELLLEFGS